jgi:putative nucleotidyltransferase with HDIG domain
MSIVSDVTKLVENACKKDTNYFGYTAWSEHIINVVKYAKVLAHQMKADAEVVELAALLHDYASVSNYAWYPEHHVHGARLAREILEKYNYPDVKIRLIEACIISHRGSKTIKRESVEAEILASADAMAHFDNLNSLFYLAYKTKGLSVDEANLFILGKLERSWNKLIPEAKKIVKPQYDAAKLLLNN